MVAPHLNQVLRALSQHFTGEMAEQWNTWRERYIPALLLLLREMRRESTEKSRTRAAAIEKAVNPLLPEPRRQASLSRKALWVLASTPGVTCVLNGARTAAYVDDSSAVLQWEPLAEVQPIYAALRPAG